MFKILFAALIVFVVCVFNTTKDTATALFLTGSLILTAILVGVLSGLAGYYMALRKGRKIEKARSQFLYRPTCVKTVQKHSRDEPLKRLHLPKVEYN